MLRSQSDTVSRRVFENRLGLVVLVTLSVIGVDTLAQSGSSLEGTFSSKGAKFEVGAGVAFTGRPSRDGETPVILVVITNTG